MARRRDRNPLVVLGGNILAVRKLNSVKDSLPVRLSWTATTRVGQFYNAIVNINVNAMSRRVRRCGPR